MAVPLFIINAADDTFFDPDFFPFEESVDGGSLAPIKMERTEYGGHIGYMFALTDERLKVDRQVSWMPSELPLRKFKTPHQTNGGLSSNCMHVRA